ncbi:MAG: type II secretion system minor pseudopilin GspH [Oceanobacter sp.]
MTRNRVEPRINLRYSGKNAGFTLLEVLVVLFIIGALLSLVGLNSSDRQTIDTTEQFAESLVVQMNQYRDEAVYTNQDLGLAMTENELLLLSFQDPMREEVRAMLDRDALDALIKNPWQPYSSPNTGIGTPTVPEGLSFKLTIDEVEVDYDELIDDETGALPALMFLSSEEYTAFELVLLHEADERFEVQIHGDGFNPVWAETLVYDND